jgi:hypothetical protein
MAPPVIGIDISRAGAGKAIRNSLTPDWHTDFAGQCIFLFSLGHNNCWANNYYTHPRGWHASR